MNPFLRRVLLAGGIVLLSSSRLPADLAPPPRSFGENAASAVEAVGSGRTIIAGVACLLAVIVAVVFWKRRGWTRYVAVAAIVAALVLGLSAWVLTNGAPY